MLEIASLLLIAYFARSGSWVHLSLGVGSFIGSILLAWYGVWFLRKLKGVSYL